MFNSTGVSGLLLTIVLALLVAPCLWALAQDKPAAPAAVKEVEPKTVRPGVKAYYNLNYAGNTEVRQMLDLYLPEKPGKAMPLMIYIHGGGWGAGSKEGPPDWGWVEKGYAFAAINYRYSQQAIFPAQIEDCKAAIRYLRANAKKYNIDPARVGVWGHSAGGHLSALVGTSSGVKALEGKVGNCLDQSSAVQVVVDLAGPTDLLLPNQPGALADVFRGLVGGPPAEHKELARQASPVTHISKTNPPMLIVHGMADDIVPIKHAELLEAGLKKVGVEVKLLALKDTGHGGGGYDTPATHKEIEDFFAKHLKPVAATQPAAPK